MSRRGFTLLEVLVAVSILGLGLSVILSSQVGLFAGVAHSKDLGFATNLAKCRMSELEVDLVKNGYPLDDESETGHCCEDEDDSGYKCSWKIERVELPQPPMTDSNDPLTALTERDGGLGAIGAMADLQKDGADALKGGNGIEGITGMFAQSGGFGSDALASMAMALVYPGLKPMLEASIRKLTVTVAWKQGHKAQEFSVIQYVTNPMQGNLDTDAMDGGVPPIPGMGSPMGAGFGTPGMGTPSGGKL
jgi:general secretion pathway protein I